ncbi:hypothetical protein NP493_306g00000 [Ridgeia piscesae]|uniref:Uncharacterized protein n=1 Tax=Ridgeia piscesae TaxID=27915 RepID=A0AAD9L5W3_RIDPI|nr:hypothetical protein NP493_306g00000 [Ridgeia piscesae]
MPDFDPNMRYAIKEKYWKQIILSMVKNIVESMPPIFDNCDGGLYLGCAGIAYMLDYLANSEPFANDKSVKEEFLTRARNYADVSLSYANSKSNSDPPAAFLLGSAGVFAVSSLVYSDIGEKKASDELNKKYLALAATCQPVNYLNCGSDELFVVNKDAIKMLITATIHSGKTYAKGHGSASPLMYAYYDTEYLGMYPVVLWIL